MATQESIIAQAQQQSIEDFASDARFWIYGAPMRPMSGAWARIPGAIFVNANYREEGVHTFVVVQAALDEKTIAGYELVLKFEPAQEKPVFSYSYDASARKFWILKDGEVYAPKGRKWYTSHEKDAQRFVKQLEKAQ